MQPNHSDLLGPRRTGRDNGASHMNRASRNMALSATDPRRFLSEDSWVEIASQPSSSSHSSIGDEVITTGLDVQNRRDPKRRRRLNAIIANNMQSSPRPASAAGSSQDEYDESSSESDRIMSSSNEDIGPQVEIESPPQDEGHDTVDGDDEDDEDDTSTALGTRTADTVFTPQPNAFTHPPSSQIRSTPSSSSLPQPDSYFPSPSSDRLPSNRTITARDLRRPSLSRSQRSSHTPYNMISPSYTYQPDHDAALRASLSTLLSCAAAARGLPKRDPLSGTTTRRPGGDAIDTNTLRMVPESEIKSRETSPQLPARPPAEVQPSRSSAPSPPGSVKATSAAASKRKAVRESSKDRHSKKSRGTSAARNNQVDEAAISPTLMTWMVSAGVVILFSAISFSAGFVLGREVGQLEAGGVGAADLGGQGGRCGREFASQTEGLRRLRWSSGAASSIRA